MTNTPMIGTPNTTGTIKYSLDGDGVAILAIDLPGKSMNVLTPELMDDLETLVKHVAADPAVKGAVITSAKKAFIAGADIKDMVTAYDRGITPKEGFEFSQQLTRRLRTLETCGKPFAVAMNGLALGGGLEVCLACHYRVMTDDPRAVVGFPEVNIGLLPGAGGTQRLPRLIGVAEALPLILQSKNVNSQKALELGIVHELAPADQVVERARKWVLETGCSGSATQGYGVYGGDASFVNRRQCGNRSRIVVLGLAGNQGGADRVVLGVPGRHCTGAAR